MSRSDKGFIGLLILGIVVINFGLSNANATSSDVRTPPDYLTFQPPAAGQSYTDPVFGTAVKRITNAMTMQSAATGGVLGSVYPEYSTISPFNMDNTRLILAHFSYYGLYDGDGNFLKNLPLEVNTSSEPKWSRTDPNEIYYINGNRLKKYNVGTNTASVVRTFGEYSSITAGGESDIAFDGNRLALAGNGQHIFVYNIDTDTKGPVFDTGGRGWNQLYLTPDGNVLVGWYQNGTGRYSGVEMFDRNMNFLRQVAPSLAHMDVTRDVNGDEVLVLTNSNDPTPICNNGIVKVRLSDAHETCLLELDWSMAVHISGTDRGSVFIDTYVPSDPMPPAGWTAYANELLQVKLDGSEVRRLVHHRSRPFNSYTYQPRVTSSRDGSKIVYGSNYSLQKISNNPAEYSDAYLINVGGSSGTPGTPPPTPPPGNPGTPTPVPPPVPSPVPPPVPPEVGGRFPRTPGILASSLTQGYATIDGDAQASSTAMFSFCNPRGVVVSEAGVPASPMVRAGRISVEIGGHANTGIAFANPGATPAAVTFFFTDSQRNAFGQNSIVIPAGGQVARFLTDAPFNAPEMNGTFTFNSNASVSVIALRGFTNERSEFLITTLPVSRPGESISGSLVVPHYAQGRGWSTRIVLVNPTDNAISGKLTFRDTAGQPAAADIPYQIAPRAAWSTTRESAGDAIQSGSVQITPSGSNSAPAGHAMYTYRPNGVTVSETGVAATAAGKTFVTYAETTSRLLTGIAVWNGASIPEQINVELLRLDGSPAGFGHVMVPARGQFSRFLNEIPGLESLANFHGILRIYSTSRTPISAIALRGRINGRNDFIVSTMNTTVEGDTATGPLMFPHLVDGGGYATEFLMGTTGTMRMFSQSGASLNLSVQ